MQERQQRKKSQKINLEKLLRYVLMTDQVGLKRGAKTMFEFVCILSARKSACRLLIFLVKLYYIVCHVLQKTVMWWLYKHLQERF